MARSIKKGPFVDDHHFGRKVESMNASGDRKVTDLVPSLDHHS